MSCLAELTFITGANVVFDIESEARPPEAVKKSGLDRVDFFMSEIVVHCLNKILLLIWFYYKLVVAILGLLL